MMNKIIDFLVSFIANHRKEKLQIEREIEGLMQSLPGL